MADEVHNEADNSAESTAPAPDTGSAVTETVVTPSANELLALEKVRHYMGWSVAGGLVPIPGLDVAALFGVQLKMLSEIGKVYGVTFRREQVKRLVSSLVGSFGSVVAAQVTGSAIKHIPVVGTIAAAFWQPALASATTWALGKVFIQHFEKGGTFLDFDPEKAQSYFRTQFEAMRAATKGAPKEEAPKEAPKEAA
ncbi:YcjF family protein [Niveispirillum sp.]|uniref:YcjF family protein n=1 Tax=Niveispirillum sp. TaxID=1917217 RepID=UPI001B721282|nr:DUF697 domain-containing protein [Niveispirillum sp.]MBP7338334.1 DUF697 domain-containing protein [Niveispirillum sp.]